MAQFKWFDGSVKNVHVDPTLLFDYQVCSSLFPISKKGSLELLPIISEYAILHIKLGTKLIAFQISSLMA